MDKKLRTLLGVILSLLLALIIFLLLKFTHRPEMAGTPAPTPPGAPSSPTARQQPCPGETKTFTMPDNQMSGVLKKGQTFKVVMNWYGCHALEKGDVVYYRYSTAFDPIVRNVRAVAGDKFEVKKDLKRGAWNLVVNGEMLMDSTGKSPYYFGAANPTVLSLYEKSNQGVLHAGDVILLANVPPGANDSGIFGVANVADILGKVEPVSE